MNEQALEQRIAARKEQAAKRNIGGKAVFVAKYLGSGSEREDSNGFDHENYGFERDGLKVTYSYDEGELGCGSQTSVYQKNKLVFNYRSDIDTYIPGKWETQLNKLYVEATAAKEKKELGEQELQKKRQAESLEQKARRFGL